MTEPKGERRAGSSADTYDGFISYSHAADDLLAPRLQAGLQRFAKPWWKRRAVRIFRDESSLSANPHLWSSITEALDTSGWFVLLLSPDAARSEWVNQEISYWVGNRDANRILPVVTDGTFGWASGDVTGDAAPESLRGVFSEEPRWVDVRWAKDEDQLDLQDPRFADAVADIASTIRGIPKDDLASEEVRQHRRTVRTAWAAGTALLILTVVAVAAGVFAISQRNDAQDNAALAEQEASRANQEADRANALADQEAAARAEAQVNAERATRSATLARSRELSASAINILDSDPELAILLTLEAIHQTPSGEEQPAEVIDALWRAVQEDRLVRIIDSGFEGNLGVIALSPDGSTLVVANHGTALVQAYAVPESTLKWELRGGEADHFITVRFSPDGEFVVIGGSGQSPGGTHEVARVIILDASDGSELRTIDYPECPAAFLDGFWLREGERFLVTPFSFSYSGPPCPREGAAEGSWTEVLDGETFEAVSLVPLPAAELTQQRFDRDGRMFLLSYDDVTILDPPEYDVGRTLAGVHGYGDVSRDGSTVITVNGRELTAYDTETGAVVDRLTPQADFPFEIGTGFTGPDGWFVSPSSEATVVWDLTTGDRLYELHSDTAWSSVISPDGRWMYTGHTLGIARMWDLGPAVGFEEAGDVGAYEWVDGNSFFLGPDLGAFAGFDLDSPDPVDFGRMFFFDPGTGALVGDSVVGHPAGALADGRFLNDARVNNGAVSLVDPRTGDQQLVLTCSYAEDSSCIETGTRIEVAVSVDGSELLILEDGVYTFVDPTDLSTIDSYRSGHSFIGVFAFTDRWIVGQTDSVLGDGDLVVEDRVRGAELARVIAPAGNQVSANDSSIAIWNGIGLQILDTETWEIRSLEIDVPRVRGMSVDWDRQRFALGDEAGLHVFDLATGQPLTEVPMPSVSDIHWLDEDTVLVGTNNGLWVKVPLRTDDLVASAVAGVTRGFTEAECATYRIDPCPTLDEIRNR